jgi:tRNA dimethylallyltransferase
LQTVVISADSRQFYRELSIGTARPSENEMGGIRHYFVGNLSIQDYINVSRYEKEVLALLDKLFIQKDQVLLVGGSGMYIDAVCSGIDDFPDPDPELRNYLKGLLMDEGLDKLRELLKNTDPKYYAEVDLQNPARIQRALEVCLTTLKPFSEQRLHSRKTRNFNIIKTGINLPRPELVERINKRVDAMMDAGLLGEVRNLLQYRHLNALNTVGYKELLLFLDGEVSLARAVENIKTDTRRYAKRQLTWFKRDPEISWFEAGEVDAVLDLIVHRLT